MAARSLFDSDPMVARTRDTAAVHTDIANRVWKTFMIANKCQILWFQSCQGSAVSEDGGLGPTQTDGRVQADVSGGLQHQLHPEQLT